MKRFLLLDIDGVLNRWDFDQELFRKLWQLVVEQRQPISVMKPFLDPSLVARVNLLVRMSKCDVVLSSNWRNLFKHEPTRWNATHKELGLEFKVAGFTEASKALNRGEQCYQWMQAEGVFTAGSSTIAVAIDDDPSIGVLPEANFVRCDPNYGLKVREAREAFRKLHGVAEGDVCEGEAAFADEAMQLDAVAWKTRHSGLVGLAAREAMPFESKGRK